MQSVLPPPRQREGDTQRGHQRYLAALQPRRQGKSAEKTFLANLRNRLDSLVNQITLLRPDAHLLVAIIIPMNVSSGGKLLNSDVKTYDRYIEDTLVPKYQNPGRQVSFVNQYQNFVSPNGTFKATLLPDGVHPNQAGYDLMAETWSIAISPRSAVKLEFAVEPALHGMPPA